jgi:hypothetical protein
MATKVDLAIVFYAAAHEIADKNPKLLNSATTAAECRAATDLCSLNMHKLHRAEETLWSFKGQPVPTPLQKFFDAKDISDTACCWHKSNPNDIHPECQTKIDNYFQAQKELIDYAKTLDDACQVLNAMMDQVKNAVPPRS